MAQPLTVGYKVRLDYEVNALPHKLDLYADASPTIAMASGWGLWDRDGAATIDAATAMQNLWDRVRQVFDNHVLPPTATLYQRSGLIYNPVLSLACTGSGALSGAQNVGESGQFTISMRTTLFHRIRMIIMEQNAIGLAVKYYGTTGYPAAFDSIIEGFTNAAPDAFDPFNWVRSRNAELLNFSAPFVSSTWDLNDKVRRARGVR